MTLSQVFINNDVLYLYMQNQQLELFYKNKSLNLKEKKEIFLRSIISKNNKSQNKYKRVALSTIRYAGGKSLAVGHVF